MFSSIYQYALIILGVVTTVLFAMFWQRELFPEYKIYQNDYVELEKFRSTYTHEPPPDFTLGVKQIVMERDDKGPPAIDRCISCHVALQFSHFSPTKIAYDINGNIELDANGIPRQVPNEDYVWARLDAKIAELGDSKEAEKYKALKTAKVGEHTYDVTKVLAMHPLMGRETRPFEFHPIEEMGCVSCHSGNGRGLVTDRAHGPVFDGQYEEEFRGFKPQFTEPDPQNDPPFAHMFNEKPGDRLLFQTTPILIGGLIEAKCMNCHLGSRQALHGAVNTATLLTEQRQKRFKAVERAFLESKESLVSLMELRESITGQGYEATLQKIQSQAKDYSLPPKERAQFQAQLKFLTEVGSAQARVRIDREMEGLLGSPLLVTAFDNKDVDAFIEAHRADLEATGSLFSSVKEFEEEQKVLRQVVDTESSFSQAIHDPQVIAAIESDIDRLTPHFRQGEELYISQACYACHRISGFARGGVGPELTRAASHYPWFLKESMVWPQADVATSTMPNFRFDHDELEDLTTFLLAQQGENRVLSGTAYKTKIQQWEAGKKLPWEEPITPVQMHDVRFAMKVFATEGCAACHRLKGFESDVGYRVEKEKADFNQLYADKEWFKRLIPEMIVGSELVKVVETHAEEIDKRIVAEVRTGSILEEIEKEFPGQIEALYTPFKYAVRAKNSQFRDKPAELAAWKERLHRVLMLFVQEYGLGRLVGPRPNWSGVYRSDEWLMEHFHNPSGHVARSIMPVFPFDESKFYALTYMLDVLAQKNRKEVKQVWEEQGFNPAQAFQIYCAQCHGEFLQGNGPVAEWIYPIPKNLRNADFLRNLTRERVVSSITHGVKGTPMPPWGEVSTGKPVVDQIPVLNPAEIQQLTNWLFSALPGAEVIKSASDVPKWRYMPEDVLKELDEEGNVLKSGVPAQAQPSGSKDTPSSIFGQLSADEPATLNPVQDVFDVIQNPLSGPDPLLYYIKKQYYTVDNLEQGRAFFELNCAVCHGADADGSGLRAGTMRDAKPRMLTNLDWINTRDDLRLLRSIKFGVPGTAMNPWGDQTSSLQRLQLVMFIRSLNFERHLRDELTEALYKTYDQSVHAVNNSRVTHYPELDKINKTYLGLQARRRDLYETAVVNKEAIDLYQQELEAFANLRKEEEVDQLLQALTTEIAREKALYQDLGLLIITQQKSEEALQPLLNIIETNANRYSFKEGKLSARFEPADEKKMAIIGKDFVEKLQGQIDQLKRKPNQDQHHEISALEKLRVAFISSLEEAVRLRQKQRQLLQQFQSRTAASPDEASINNLNKI